MEGEKKSIDCTRRLYHVPHACNYGENNAATTHWDKVGSSKVTDNTSTGSNSHVSNERDEPTTVYTHKKKQQNLLWGFSSFNQMTVIAGLPTIYKTIPGLASFCYISTPDRLVNTPRLAFILFPPPPGQTSVTPDLNDTPLPRGHEYSQYPSRISKNSPWTPFIVIWGGGGGGGGGCTVME